MLEVLTGKDPWWFLTDGDLYNTRFPPKDGQVSVVRYRPEANPLDDAKAAGRLVYLVNDRVLIDRLEVMMHKCFSVEPAARPSMHSILDELIRLRDGELPSPAIRVSNRYIGDAGAASVDTPVRVDRVYSKDTGPPPLPVRATFLAGLFVTGQLRSGLV